MNRLAMGCGESLRALSVMDGRVQMEAGGRRQRSAQR